jgi:hypothetical protein
MLDVWAPSDFPPVVKLKKLATEGNLQLAAGAPTMGALYAMAQRLIRLCTGVYNHNYSH